MMNQGIGSILDSINQALLQYVAAEQVKPVMQQISQLLAPFNDGQAGSSMTGGPFSVSTMPVQQPMSNMNSSDATNNAALARTQDMFSPSSYSMSNHPAFSGPTPLAPTGKSDNVLAIPGMPQVDPAPEKIGIGSLL